MANGNGQLRVDPTNSNIVGEANQDSKFLPEFTFNHGIVKQVINEEEDLSTTIHSEAEIPSDLSQCILITLASSEVESDYIKKPYLAQPLMRGFSDSIAKDDSVIFTSIGDTLFYLGPINTANNPNYSPNTKIVRSTDLTNDEGKENPNYHKMNIKKTNKIKIPILDHPYETLIGDYGSAIESESSYSDLQLEGRHGNSIKIGSRFINPYIVIGNNNIAGTNNGSVLGMLSLGSISQNFLDFTQLSVDKVVAEANEKGESGYLGFPIGHGNDSKGTPPENIFNNDFGAVQESPELQTEFDQIIMFSDRITFDARENDLTVSAFRNINFGAGKNFTLTNKGFTVLESKNIYIGKSAKQRSQPMVLGEELRRLLVSILRLINDSRALVQGVPIPLMKQDSSPLLADITKIMQEFNLGMMPPPGGTPESPDPGYNIQVEEEKPLGDRTTGGATFFSNHHFIETNRS